MKFAHSAKTLLQEVFFPPRCLLCGVLAREWFCTLHAPPIPQPFRKASPNLIVTGVQPYHHPSIEALVSALKFRGLHSLALLQAQHIQHALPQDWFRGYTLAPIPLHWRRKWVRGFNQAELLAKILSEQLQLPLSFPLYRRRYTQPQSLLSRKERLQNVKNAFGVKKGEKIPSRILLIDDVSTTGATLQEAAKVLAAFPQVREIRGLVFAIS